jgi:phage-related holin
LRISINVKEPKGEYDMPLIQVVITLVVIGVLLGLVNRFIPMQSSIKSILNGIVVIGVVLWIVNLFGLFAPLSRIHIGK